MGQTTHNIELLRGGDDARPPAAALLGWRLLDVEPGFVKVEYEAREAFYNPAGVVQGGILSAMLDDAMGPAGFSVLEPGQFAPTLDLHVRFMRAARAGKLYAEGRVEHRTRSVLFLSGWLYDSDGRTIATATATARIGTARDGDASAVSDPAPGT